MRKFSRKEQENGSLATRFLSEEALDFYVGTDLLRIYEYETEEQKLYAYDGDFGYKDGLTFEELDAALIELAEAVRSD